MDTAEANPSIQQLKDAIEVIRQERKRQDRMRSTLGLTVLGIFAVFFIALSALGLSFDKAKFMARVEAGAKADLPQVMKQSTEVGKYVLAEFAKTSTKELPGLEDHLTAAMSREADTLRLQLSQYGSGDAAGLAANYVDHDFRSALLGSVPGLSEKGRIDRVMHVLREPAIHRTEEVLREEMTPDLKILNELQSDLRALQAEAGPPAGSERLMLAALDVMRLRLAAGDTLDFPGIGDTTKAGKGKRGQP